MSCIASHRIAVLLDCPAAKQSKAKRAILQYNITILQYYNITMRALRCNSSRAQEKGSRRAFLVSSRRLISVPEQQTKRVIPLLISYTPPCSRSVTLASSLLHIVYSTSLYTFPHNTFPNPIGCTVPFRPFTFAICHLPFSFPRIQSRAMIVVCHPSADCFVL